MKSCTVLFGKSDGSIEDLGSCNLEQVRQHFNDFKWKMESASFASLPDNRQPPQVVLNGDGSAGHTQLTVMAWGPSEFTALLHGVPVPVTVLWIFSRVSYKEFRIDNMTQAAAWDVIEALFTYDGVRLASWITERQS